MKYPLPNLNEAELISAIDPNWNRVIDLREKSKTTKYSVKTVAKAYSRIVSQYNATHDNVIEVKRMRGVFFYRIRPGTTISPPVKSAPDPMSILEELKEPGSIAPIQKEPEPVCIPHMPPDDPDNRNHDLSIIIRDLKDYGIDIRNYVYSCLKDKHEKVKQEYEYVLQNAPDIAVGFKNLQNEMIKARNKILDLQDEKNEYLKKTMVKRFIEERKVKEGIR